MMTHSQLTAEQYWAFACQQYPKHQHVLLQMQDDCACNINLLLLCWWLDSHSLQLSVNQWRLLANTVSDNEKKLLTMRAQRRQAKGVDTELYSDLLKQELTLEKDQQALIIKQLERWLPLHSGRDNMHFYAQTFTNNEVILQQLSELNKRYYEVTTMTKE